MEEANGTAGETNSAVEDSTQKETIEGIPGALIKAQKILIEAPRTLIEEAPKNLIKAPRAATEQTVEAVRWLAKRKQFTLGGVPYGLTGLPIFYYSKSTGWNYGARVQWSDYQRQPYRYKLTMHALHSTQGRSDAYCRLKVPHLSDSGFGVILLLGDKRDIRARYYGRGNDSEYVKGFIDPQSPRFRDKNYYYYVLRNPRFILSLLRHLWGPFSTSIVLGVESTEVSPRGQTSLYLEEGTPDGVRDGVIGFVGATLFWDTRDDDTIPKQGAFHEWSYETSRNSVLGFFFEEIDFQRYTFTDARYYPLSERLNLAHRTVFEMLRGSVPLYAYGEIGGQKRIKGLGGGDSLRGFDTQRFTDNVRFFANTELRYHLRSMRIYRQYLELHGALFVDTGRVWPDLDALTLRQLHFTGGFGLRIYWNADFVIRLGIGFSSEQTYTPIKYRNVF